MLPVSFKCNMFCYVMYNSGSLHYAELEPHTKLHGAILQMKQYSARYNQMSSAWTACC